MHNLPPASGGTGAGFTSSGNNQVGVDKSLIALKKLNGASQGTFNQGSKVSIQMLYYFLNNRLAITENYQRLKIIQLLTGLPITSGHF